MKNKWRSIVIFVMAVTSCLSGLCAYAQEGDDKSDRLAVALIIDSSGSMKHNDPGKERIKAAQNAAAMLGEQDEITVVEFADTARVLVPLKKVGPESYRDEILESIAAIGSSGDTDIKGGLERAYQELDKAAKGSKSFALLISDGEPDLPSLTKSSRRMNKYLQEIDTLAGLYKNKGYEIHCIAFHREQAGPLLQKIAGQTGGEYFFVKDAVSLAGFFSSIVVVHKHAPAAKPEMEYQFKAQGYRVGQKFPVRAWLSLGDDRLVPGPHLEEARFTIGMSSGSEPVKTVEMRDDGDTSSGDEVAGDGIYSAVVECRKEGEMNLSLTFEGRYRGEEIKQVTALGGIMIKSAVSTKNLVGIGAAIFRKESLLPAVCIISLLIIASLIIKSTTRRKSRYIQGKLVYWAVDQGAVPEVKELRPDKLKKYEVVVATEDAEGTDIVLPVLSKDFAFKIKKFSEDAKDAGVEDSKDFDLAGKNAYIAVSLPGTFIQFEEGPKLFETIPRSRRQIFHGDRFLVRGYVFEFHCPEATEKLAATKDTSRLLKKISKKKGFTASPEG